MAGYPGHVLISVAESGLRKLNRQIGTSVNSSQGMKKVVVPYIHNVSHALKKIGQKVKVDVLFSAPQKLMSICKATDPLTKRRAECVKKHQCAFVPCVNNVVYRFPFSCGKVYFGQSGRCLNDRLREHKQKLGRYRDGHVSVHCNDCGCEALFKECRVVYRNADKTTREIVEAAMIARAGDSCVSCPSVALTANELAFLDAAGFHVR